MWTSSTSIISTLRNDDAKAVQRLNEVENLEMHNEG
jgi:amidophosphoribosyltransferase